MEAFDLRERPGLLSRFSRKDLRSRLRKAISDAKADLVLAIGASALDRQTVTELSAITSIPWVNWFPNDLRTIEEVSDRAPAYQHVFAAGSDVADRLARVVHRPVEVVPLAADPSIYRPLRSRDQYRANVVFAGTATRRREELLERTGGVRAGALGSGLAPDQSPRLLPGRGA